jgi:hypothetical protein
MARANQPTRPVAAGPTGLPRLLPPNPSTDLRGHLAEYGSIPPSSIHVVDHVRAAGLLGRGGAGFPTGTKMAAVAQRGRRPIIVANGTEGEPASAKDKVLMTHSPHLVLDGISIAAAALDATDAVLCIDRSDHGIVALMEHAISERNTAGVDRVPLRLEIAPDRYVAGEETALVRGPSRRASEGDPPSSTTWKRSPTSLSSPVTALIGSAPSAPRANRAASF